MTTGRGYRIGDADERRWGSWQVLDVGHGYALKRSAVRRFLTDGRICLTNNTAERTLRGIAIGRQAWLFAGRDRGCERATAIYSLIVSAKLNKVDPSARLTDVLERISDQSALKLHEPLHWN
jgi:hypothetical protein